MMSPLSAHPRPSASGAVARSLLLGRRRFAAALAIPVLALSACGTGGDAGTGSDGAASDGGASNSAMPTPGEQTEVAALTPRIVLAHEGGVTTLDSAKGEVLSTVPMEGYLRLGPAGDDRHVAVTNTEGFTFLDTGLIAQGHGDHFHYYTQNPYLTDLTVKGEHAGHVVPHGDRTALFADGTGEVTVLEPEHLAEGELGETTTVASAAAHHGVAVPLSDGGILRTEGTEDSRSTVLVEDADGNEVARTDDCPGVHGEATAQPTDQGDVVSIGCENGPVVYRDGAFHKVPVEEAWQRSGNQKGSEASPIVLADYKVEEEPKDPAGIERPTTVGLIDTRNDTVKKVDLGSPYWFRSLDRGENGEALVLTYDGELNILDPNSGEVLHEVPAVQPWEEDENWQKPGPMMAVADGTAFVVDPANKHLVMIDIASGEIYREFDLTVEPHEIQVTTGMAPSAAPAEDDHADHDHEGEGHDHEGEDHDHEGEDHDHAGEDSAEHEDHDHDH